MKITIATRKSALAMWQACHVKNLLLKVNPSLQIDLLPLTTKGDIKLDTSLAKIGGKGLFIKELEHALLDGRADMAVHSAKDLPDTFPEKLAIAAVCGKDNNKDCLLANDNYKSLSEIPLGSIIGTSSLRRTTQLLNIRPDLKVKLLRGNIKTRISKLESKLYHGIILASCGVDRIKLGHKINFEFNYKEILPAAGQGLLAVEISKENHKIYELLQNINDTKANQHFSIERKVLSNLNASCHAAIGVMASEHEDKINLQAVVGNSENNQLIKVSQSGSKADELVEYVTNELVSKGARDWL